MDYIEDVAYDAKEYFDEWFNYSKDKWSPESEYDIDYDDIINTFEEDSFRSDQVTGAGSGSHFMSSYKARQAILENDIYLEDYVREGIMSYEWIGRLVASGNWEGLDVEIRCSVLPEAISSIREELEEIILKEYSKNFSKEEED